MGQCFAGRSANSETLVNVYNRCRPVTPRGTSQLDFRLISCLHSPIIYFIQYNIAFVCD